MKDWISLPESKHNIVPDTCTVAYGNCCHVLLPGSLQSNGQHGLLGEVYPFLAVWPQARYLTLLSLIASQPPNGHGKHTSRPHKRFWNANWLDTWMHFVIGKYDQYKVFLSIIILKRSHYRERKRFRGQVTKKGQDLGMFKGGEKNKIWGLC